MRPAAIYPSLQSIRLLIATSIISAAFTPVVAHADFCLRDTLASVASNFKLAPDRRLVQLDREREITSVVREMKDQPLAQKKLADKIDQILWRGSEKLSGQIIEAGAKEYDVIVIGNGIHGGIAALNLDPRLRVLVVDSGMRPVESFSKFGESFLINSPELPTATANLFPGGVIQVKDLSSKQFVTSEALANTGLFNYYSAGADTLLNTKINPDNIHTFLNAQGKHEVMINLELGGKPVQLKARKQVIIATGLGKPKVALTDAPSLKLFEQESAKAYPDRGVVLFDDVMTESGKRQLRAQSQPIHRAYADEEVAIIGSGDSANVLVETLAKDRGPKKIQWVRQKSSTPEAFKAANKRRYDQTVAPLLDSPLIETNPHYCTKVRELAPKGALRQFELTITDDLGRSTTHVVNRVFIATGYENVFVDVLKKRNYNLKNIIGEVPGVGKSTILGKKLYLDETELPISILGPAGGELATDEELAKTITKNSVSINALSGRTAAAAKLIH